VVDGPTLVTEAIASPVPVEAVYVEPSAPEEVRSLARSAGVPVHEVAAGALARVTSPVTPQAVAAVARIPPSAGLEVCTGLVLVLVGLSDPGNAGTLFRIAEAAGAGAVVTCADAVDVWNPKCVRASAGSVFRVPHVASGDAPVLIGELRSHGLTVLAATPGPGPAHDAVDMSGDVAVLLGNEARGLRQDVVAASDGTVSVPMEGSVESLNVATTGAVLAFEAARQRRDRHPGTSRR
jgi:RNA methyltransferase, TrmH family